MITPTWQTYFYFTKKELKGIIVLGCILLGSVLISLLFTKDKKEGNINTHLANRHLFDFDPNTVDSIHAIELGLPEKQVRTLMHYRAMGGYFKTPATFSKLYGLQNDLFVQLTPFIKIVNKGSASSNHYYQNQHKLTWKGSAELVWKIDINKADEKEWTTKTQIPIALIRRIIAYRNYIGVFTHSNQVSKVYGFPDSLFQIVKSHIYVSAGTPLLLNANSMNFNDWKQIGIFTDRQIWIILKLKKENEGKIGWKDLVEACDLSQSEAILLKQKIHFGE